MTAVDERTRALTLEAIALERKTVKMYRDQADATERSIAKLEREIGVDAPSANPPINWFVVAMVFIAGFLVGILLGAIR